MHALNVDQCLRNRIIMYLNIQSGSSTAHRIFGDLDQFILPKDSPSHRADFPELELQFVANEGVRNEQVAMISSTSANVSIAMEIPLASEFRVTEPSEGQPV